MADHKFQKDQIKLQIIQPADYIFICQIALKRPHE